MGLTLTFTLTLTLTLTLTPHPSSLTPHPHPTPTPTPNQVSGAINSTLAAIRRSSAAGRVNGSYGAFDGADSYPGWGEEGEREREREFDPEFDSTRADEWDNDDDYRSEADEEGVRGTGRVRASDEDIVRYEDITD